MCGAPHTRFARRYPFPYIIPGYYEGKELAEAAVEKGNRGEFEGKGVCFRSGFVVGTRKTLPGLPTSVRLTLPLDCLCGLVGRLCPTVRVEELAAAIVRFALSEGLAERVLVGNDEIRGFFEDED